jgi:hypothetical protein
LGHDVEQLIGSFWLFVTKIVNQGAIRRVVLERRDDVGVSYPRDLVAFL